jgi:hypothetical protein
MAMPDTNAFKVLRAQKPHTDEELELIQGTVFQRDYSYSVEIIKQKVTFNFSSKVIFECTLLLIETF